MVRAVRVRAHPPAADGRERRIPALLAQRDAAAAFGERREMTQRLLIDTALEHDDVLRRIPEIDPAPEIELGMLVRVEPERGFLADEPQQEPDLFLADADRPLVMAHEPVRQAIAQPARRRAEHLNVMRTETGLFLELAVHRLDRRLVAAHAALRELPAVAPDAARPEHAAVVLEKDDADVGPVAVRVDQAVLLLIPEDSSTACAIAARQNVARQRIAA